MSHERCESAGVDEREVELENAIRWDVMVVIEAMEEMSIAVMQLVQRQVGVFSLQRKPLQEQKLTLTFLFQVINPFSTFINILGSSGQELPAK